MAGRDVARGTLDAMPDPKRGSSLLESGRVSGLVTRDDGNVGLVLAVDDLTRAEATALDSQIRRRLEAAGIASVRIVQTAERGAAPAPTAPVPDAALPGVRHIIGVGAGKGGVGKSTIAVNLALALARRGLGIGILDADIQGPSVQILLGIKGRATATADKRLIPIEAHGLKMLGMGVMADPDKAVAWRGPMIAGAVLQLATMGEWAQGGAPLDVLIVDLPPGTGDIHLSLAQKLSPSGAIVVTTPQALARADATRAVAFFELLNVPVLGVVMNMAHMLAPDGSQLQPFGPVGRTDDLGAPLLAELPLDPAVVAASDSGQPLQTGPVAQAMDKLAETVAAQLGL